MSRRNYVSSLWQRFCPPYVLLLTFLFACDHPVRPDAIEDPNGTSAFSGRLTGDNVIRYPSHRSIVSTSIIAGLIDETGSCRIERTARIMKGEALLETVIEYDPDTCTFVVAKHPPDELVVTRTAKPDHIGAQSSSAAPSAYATAFSGDYATSTLVDTLERTGGPGGPLFSSRGQDPQACYETLGLMGTGFLKAWYQDPVAIEVNSTEHENVFFYLPNEQCVQWSQSTLTSSWYLPTYWFLNGIPTIDLVPLPSNDDWDLVQAVGRAQFKNTFFANLNPLCGFPPNEVTYTRFWNELRLSYDGYVTFSLGNTFAWGDCSELLQLGWYFTYY